MSFKREIEASTQEIVYREKHFHDIRTVKDRQIACASCGNRLSLESRQIYSHPLIGILQCQICWKNFKQIDAVYDEKIEKFCYICGDSKILYECSNEDCFSAFCKKCIKRNASNSLLDAESDNWKCFVCNPRPLWELRGVCAAVMDTFSKKGNRKSIHKNERSILPSQREILAKTKKLQKNLQNLCDKDGDSSSSEERPFFSSTSTEQTSNKDRRTKKGATIAQEEREIDLLDPFSTSKNKENRKTRRRRDRKSINSRDSSSSQTSDLKPVTNKKLASKKNMIFSDSDESIILVTETSMSKGRRKLYNDEDILKTETSGFDVEYSSDSESDKDNSMSKVSNISKNLPKRTMQQNQKKCHSTKGIRVKERYDSTSDSKDEDTKFDKQTKRRSFSSTKRSMLKNNNAEKKHGKCDETSNRHLSEIVEKSDSDSSSKEFQKEKLFHNKCAMKQIKDVDYTKSSNENEMKKSLHSKNDSGEQPNLDLNNVKEILSVCKNICSTFQRNVEIIEQRYSEKNEEKFVLKSTNIINKLITVLGKKQKNLTDFQQLWSKSSKNRKNAMKKVHENLSNDERLSADESSVFEEDSTIVQNKQSNLENEQKNKEVSECDSEEIFSADETRTPQKAQTRKTVDMSRTKNNSNHSDDKIDDKDETSLDASKDSDTDHVNLQDNPISSPVLGIKKQNKLNVESNKEQSSTECINNKNSEIGLIDKNTNLTDKQTESSNTDVSDNEIEDSRLTEINNETMLPNEQNNSATDKGIINESMDMFEVSLNDTNSINKIDAQKTNVVEAKSDNAKFLSKTKSLGNINTYKDETHSKTHDDEISNEKNRRFSLPDYNGERDLLSRNNQKKAISITSNKKTHDINDSKKADLHETNSDNQESLIDDEALAKMALLGSDSDNNISINAKQFNELITDSKNSETENDDSNVNNGCSAVTSSALTNKENTAKNVDVKVACRNSDKTDKSNIGETNFSDNNENAKTEKTAKKALLESNSDDSIMSSLSEETADYIDKKVEYDAVTTANLKAKKNLLASSNSESSCSETVVLETKTCTPSRNELKRKYDRDSDNSITSTVRRKKLKLEKNYYYINDKKLRMTCEVRMTRLSKNVLKRYSRALQKSKMFLESKALESLVNLDKLEKRYKKSTKKGSEISTDDDDNESLKISNRTNKGKGKQTAKETEESLMDHFKKVENDVPTIQTDYNSDDSVNRIKKVDPVFVSNEALISEANRAARRNLLNSSDSDVEKVSDSNDSINNDENDEKTDNKKKSQKTSEDKISKQDKDKRDKSERSNWRQNKILTEKFSDTDSDAEKKKWNKKQDKLLKEGEKNNSESDEGAKQRSKPKKKNRRRIIDSDSDIKLTDCDSDSDKSLEVLDVKQDSDDSSNSKKEMKKQKRKKRKRDENKSSGTDSSFEEKRPKPKRKRIKKMSSDSDSDAQKTSQGTPGKSGRKNIRKVLKDKQVAEDTKQAAKEEEERLKRIADRQALYNDMYEMRLAGEEKVEKLVLDFDTETKEELVSVDKELVKRLKPHQAQGIKFMWDACFESLERIKTTSGSGCIIAHCMGLGKTLQVVALTHTLLYHEATNVKTILIVCPLSTVLNWVNEYKIWLKDMDDDVNLYELTKFKKNFERKYQLQRWQQTGGVLVIGYEMFRNLTGANKNIRKAMKETILECLIDPGADLIVCDEGHLLKNEDTALSKSMRKVKTMRRIILTGTPLQNNLIEYHCMVQFVKPNLLGTKKEFLNRFVNPITNGQFDDSTAYDVKLMKKRAHVLHKMLEGCVQRFDYSVLTPFLPPKQEYVIFIRLTDTQIKMYEYYLTNLARHQMQHRVGGALFADFQVLQRIWTHPVVLRLNAEKVEKANEKKLTSDSEGSLRDFINDDSTSDSENGSSDSDVQSIDDTKENTNVPKRKTRNNPGNSEEEEPEPPPKEESSEAEWWSQFVQPEDFANVKMSAKLLLLFGILKECEQIGDKVLVFSQSLYSLTLIEEFLRRIDDETQKGISLDVLDNHMGSWSLGLDYFRLDGQTSAENRSAWCRIFNRPTNTRARLFLISTRAGGLGINLTAANRVIIFDASWNPSHDVQSIFRIYRFGQKKPCYVYRFLAAGTMEEKIYNRQVTKLSLSCRVVDEQQIERHYSNHNLNELYTLEPYKTERPTLNLPKDRLLAEIFLKYKDFVENYLEHDSLLENKAEEELDEEERKQAWLEYEEEKKGKPLIPPNYQNNMLMQQYNMMMNSDQTGLMPPNLYTEYQNLQQLISKDYPNATLEQQKMITSRAMMDMYNYWERQAVLQPRNPVILTNFQNRLTAPHVMTNSNAHQISQLGRLLAGQSANYVRMNQPVSTNLVPNPFTYRNTPANNIGKTNDEIIEVSPTTSNAGPSNTPTTVQSTATNKNQEE